MSKSLRIARSTLCVAVVLGAPPAVAQTPPQRTPLVGKVRLGSLRAPAAPMLRVAAPAGAQAGEYELTLGYRGDFGPDPSGPPTVQSVPTSIDVRLTPRVAVSAGWDTIVSVLDDSDARVTGVGDAALGSAVDLWAERRYLPALAASYELKLPIADADRGLGSGELDHTVVVVAAKTFGRVQVSVTAGESWIGTPQGKAVPMESLALAAGLALPRDHALFAEIGWADAVLTSPASRYTLMGWYTPLGRSLAMQVGALAGWADAPNFGLVFQLSYSGRLQ